MKMQMHRHRATGWQKTRTKNRSSQYLSLNETSVREPPACLSPNSLINHHRKATRNTERPPSSSSSPYSSSYLPSLLEELMSINIMSCPAPTVHTALCGLLGNKRGGRKKEVLTGPWHRFTDYIMQPSGYSGRKEGARTWTNLGRSRCISQSENATTLWGSVSAQVTQMLRRGYKVWFVEWESEPQTFVHVRVTKKKTLWGFGECFFSDGWIHTHLI